MTSNTLPTPVLALPPREAAQALGISFEKLLAWTRVGDVPHVRRDRETLYPVEQLTAWLLAQSHPRVRRVELKHNNTLSNDPCVWCGARCDPTGMDYFEEGTWWLVCDCCAEFYSPEVNKYTAVEGGAL